MSQPGGQVRASQLPEPGKRYCVLRGYAEITDAGKVRYHYDRIYEAWVDSAVDDLSRFARHLEIPYSMLAKRPEFSVAGKRALRKQAAVSFRASIVESARIYSVEEIAEEAVRLRSIIDNIEEIVNLGAAYAAAKLKRKTPDGMILPNLAVSPKDAKLLVEIGKDCAIALDSVFSLRKQNAVPDEENRGVDIRPKKTEMKLVG